MRPPTRAKPWMARKKLDTSKWMIPEILPYQESAYPERRSQPCSVEKSALSATLVSQAKWMFIGHFQTDQKSWKVWQSSQICLFSSNKVPVSSSRHEAQCRIETGDWREDVRTDYLQFGTWRPCHLHLCRKKLGWNRFRFCDTWGNRYQTHTLTHQSKVVIFAFYSRSTKPSNSKGKWNLGRWRGNDVHNHLQHTSCLLLVIWRQYDHCQ